MINNPSILHAVEIANSIVPNEDLPDPYKLCAELQIDLVTNKSLKKDGYLVCCNGNKMIFVSATITNKSRKKFVISHEIGHFFMHGESLYGCTNVTEFSNISVNSSRQEHEANLFASEFLLPSSSVQNIIPNRDLCIDDIKMIARTFKMSFTSCAIKAVALSNTEEETVLYYDGRILKWYASAIRGLKKVFVPNRCPINLMEQQPVCDCTGVWGSMYVGTVHQEIINIYGNQWIVLLSGTPKYHY